MQFCYIFFSYIAILILSSATWAQDKDRDDLLKQRFPVNRVPMKLAKRENDLRDLADEFKWFTNPDSALYFGHTLRGFLTVHGSDYDKVPREIYTAVIFGTIVERLKNRFNTRLDPVLLPPPGKEVSAFLPTQNAIKESALIGFSTVGSAVAKRLIARPSSTLIQKVLPSLFPKATIGQIIAGTTGKIISGPAAPALVIYTVYSAYSQYTTELNEQKEKWFRDAERETRNALGQLKQQCEQEINNYYLQNRK